MIRPRVMLIGLDGATYDILLPLVREGVTPNIGAFYSECAHSALESTMPPITAPAWASLATGLNPGKLGVFDFWNRVDAGGFEFVPATSASVRGRAVWDMLGGAGHRVLVFNYPMLYPAYPVNGVMIAGTGSPVNERSVHPTHMWDMLAKEGFENSVGYASPRYAGRPGKLGSDVLRFARRHRRLAMKLLESERWDLAVVVISATDFAQHYFGMPDDPRADQDSRRHRAAQSAFRRIWREVDEFVGDLVGYCPVDSYVAIVSDHGFGSERGYFHINNWLAQRGYLKLKAGAESRPFYKDVLRLRALARSVGRFCPGLFSFLQERFHGRLRFGSVLDLVDLESSDAISLGSMVSGFVYCLGTAVQGRLLDEMRSVESIEGVPVRIEAYGKEEIYHGPYLDRAPDIVFSVNGGEAVVVDRLSTEGKLFVDDLWVDSRMGTHRRDGILLVRGPMVEPGSYGKCRIVDVAPFILAAFGVQPPSDLDGELMGFMAPASRRGPLQGARRPGSSDASELDEEEKAEIERRLKGLGYL
ncbi:MAG: alkaline phosphatase family protein [Planctomycetota bacterium]